jgi:splicing factor 3B subunit 3
MSMLRGASVALYNLTLSSATAIYHAVYGNFSGPRQQEIVVSRGKILQLLRPNPVGQVQVLASVEVCPVMNPPLLSY